jgi:hypothetical protein
VHPWWPVRGRGGLECRRGFAEGPPGHGLPLPAVSGLFVPANWRALVANLAQDIRCLAVGSRHVGAASFEEVMTPMLEDLIYVGDLQAVVISHLHADHVAGRFSGGTATSCSPHRALAAAPGVA